MAAKPPAEDLEMSHILAIDQGTTSSRAIIFSSDLKPMASAQKEFTQHYPAAGWVEHDLEEIWAGVLDVSQQAIAKAHLQPRDIAAIGITNQRETTVVWDRATGEAIHKAIVWQDRRTAETCQTLKAAGHEPLIAARTGLLLDPYSFWMPYRAHGRARSVVNWLSVQSIVFCSGDSRAEQRMRPTRQTHRGRCCATFIRVNGMMSF